MGRQLLLSYTGEGTPNTGKYLAYLEVQVFSRVWNVNKYLVWGSPHLARRNGNTRTLIPTRNAAECFNNLHSLNLPLEFGVVCLPLATLYMVGWEGKEWVRQA
jgi:hypothetical protein